MNCVHDIFAATDEEFALIFPDGQDIAFIDEVYERSSDDATLNRAFEAMGIHGQLFYELEAKKVFYPTRRDKEAANPDGSSLR